ncbi:hypothetical protein Bca4012_065680 [Brassica carinata]
MGGLEAVGKSLKTWKSWVLEKIDPDKSYVFFRSTLQCTTEMGHGIWRSV